MNDAEYRRLNFPAASPFNRTFRPKSGNAIPRLPQNLPLVTQGDSQPRPSTPWYSTSPGAIRPLSESPKPSIQARLPRFPIHSPNRPGLSPAAWI
jgi:hypothetical protein